MNQRETNLTVMEQLECMLLNERHPSYRCRDYLNSQSQHEVSATDRFKLCQWAYSITSACSLDLSVACVAILFFDRFLSSGNSRAQFALTSPPQFQLAFATALFLALKTHSGMNVELDFFSENVCGDLYRKEDLVEMEMEMLKALSWKLCGPTTHDFIEYFIELSHIEDGSIRSSLITDSKIIAASAMMRYPELHMPSHIALTSIVESIEQLQDVTPVQKVLLIHGIASAICDHEYYTNDAAPQKDSITPRSFGAYADNIVSLASQVVGRSMNQYRRIFSPSA
ncbi:hypothetical protein ACHAWO_000142 [Cyclotella atomus]|uniref:Cyclin N-terminal domain-containing protein n=1 Tax=Cyclotella atomus TaxID=382360 RepID=A0ABD3NWT1_9STRA